MKAGLTCLLLLTLPVCTFAGSLNVSPIKILLEPSAKTTQITLSNNNAEKVSIQITVAEWTQNEKGQDVYTPTKDILFFPKIFTVEQNQQILVRIHYQGPPVRDVEKTYRLFLLELPVSKPGETSLKMPLQVGIPIFVKPVKDSPQVAIENAEVNKQAIRVWVKNSGNSHLQIRKIHATGFDASGSTVFSNETDGWYVLAGTSKPFAMKIGQNDCAKVKSVQWNLESDKNKMDAKTELSNSVCEP